MLELGVRIFNLLIYASILDYITISFGSKNAVHDFFILMSI